MAGGVLFFIACVREQIYEQNVTMKLAVLGQIKYAHFWHRIFSSLTK